MSDLKSQYVALNETAHMCCQELHGRLGELLAASDIALAVPIQHRVKLWPSIEEKIQRKGLRLDSLTELDDLVGLRVILLYRRDVLKACRVIQDSWSVVSWEDAESRLDESQFGYASSHLVVELAGCGFESMFGCGYRNLRAEIQLRTLAQHLWAVVSHKLQYKREASVPATVRRAIHRASAILETVDLEFERVLEEREEYLKSVAAGEIGEPLNVDSLRQVLDDVWPPANRMDTQEWSEDYDRLLVQLQYLGIRTTDQLVPLLKKNADSILAGDAKLAAREARELVWSQGDSARKMRERCMLGVFCSHGGLTRAALEREFKNVPWHAPAGP